MQLKSAVPSAADRCCAENEKHFSQKKVSEARLLKKGNACISAKCTRICIFQRIEKLRSQRREIVENGFFLQKKLFVKNIDEQEIL